MIKAEADGGHLGIVLENQHLVQVLSEVEEECKKLEKLLRFSSLEKVVAVLFVNIILFLSL